MIRSFDWRDFPTLHRNRNEGLYLDTSLALTRWMTLVPAGALLATLAPATGIFTFVATNQDTSARRVVGQFMHLPGSPFASLTFITPEAALESHDVPALLDHLAAQAGARGAHHLLAEVDERSPAYEVLRRSGFVIYTRQRIWELNPGAVPETPMWQPVVASDEPNIHLLYHALVPALVQQIEPPPWQNLNGMTHFQKGELLAYVSLQYGPKGILAQPLVHPDTEDVNTLLQGLRPAIPNTRGKTVYLGVRSHQAWLAPFLSDLGYNFAPRQAVMVKRLALKQKVKMPLKVPNGLEKARPEISSSTLQAANHPTAQSKQPRESNTQERVVNHTGL